MIMIDHRPPQGHARSPRTAYSKFHVNRINPHIIIERFCLVPLLAEQRVLGECYIVGRTDDRTFCLLWIRVIRLPYLATYEPSKYAIQCACGEQGFCRRRRHFEYVHRGHFCDKLIWQSGGDRRLRDRSNHWNGGSCVRRNSLNTYRCSSGDTGGKMRDLETVG